MKKRNHMKDRIPNYLIVYKNEITGEIKLTKLLNPVKVPTAKQLFEFQYNNRIRTKLFGNFIPDSVKSDLESGDLDYVRDLYNQVVYYSKRENFTNITVNLN